MYKVLLEDFLKDVPGTLEQVQLRYLRVMDQGRADELARRLGEGDPFEVLKEEIEFDEEAPGYGSDLQWFTEETLEQNLGVDIVDQAFGMDAGVFTQESEGVYYVVEVVDHRIRDVEDTLADQLANMALQQWVESQQELVERLEFDPKSVLVDAPASPENPLMNP
jgi:hypothetical protein